jgi:hypothetical protein
MKGWGPARKIRASVLRHLLEASEWPVHAKGVRLRGARITGNLDLGLATLRCPLVLENCYLEQRVVLDDANGSLVKLVHCWLAGLTADLLIVTKELDLGRSYVDSAVRLTDASIIGGLNFSGAEINNSNGNALIADRVTVGGNLFLNEGFTASGAIRLSGANVAGDLRCSSAVITGSDKGRNSLIADSINVGGSLLLDGIRADGAVGLAGANVTGDFNCRAAQLYGTNTKGALIADEIKVGGDVILDRGGQRKRFTAAGAVRLHGADITGEFNCRGAMLTGTTADGALIADKITVGGDVILENGFEAAGAVRLHGANITGTLNCHGAQIKGTSTEGNWLFRVSRATRVEGADVGRP